MTDREFTQFVEQAAQQNRDMSDAEHQSGFAPPEDCTIPHHLRTVVSALEAGIRVHDWTCVGQAYVLLKDAVRRLKTTTILEVLMDMKNEKYYPKSEA